LKNKVGVYWIKKDRKWEDISIGGIIFKEETALK